MVAFEWNEAEDLANRKEHGVRFEQAKSMFFDEYAVQFYDDEHSSDEDRFIMLGMRNLSRVLVVCHCVGLGGAVIRVVTAYLTNADRYIADGREFSANSPLVW